MRLAAVQMAAAAVAANSAAAALVLRIEVKVTNLHAEIAEARRKGAGETHRWAEERFVAIHVCEAWHGEQR